MKNFSQKIFTNSTFCLMACLLLSIFSCKGNGVGFNVDIGEKAKDAADKATGVGSRAVSVAEKNVPETLRIVDKAVDLLGNTSANWLKVLEETRDTLINEANSSLRNELTNLINNGVAATGIEVRCNVDFMRNRARQELIHMRNQLARKIRSPLRSEVPLEPGLCQVTPSSIDLNLKPERRSELKLAGYDFDKNTIKVLLMNESEEIDVTSKLAQTTKYLLTLNLSPANGIDFSSGSNKILLRTAQSSKLISEVNVIQPANAKEKQKKKEAWLNYRKNCNTNNYDIFEKAWEEEKKWSERDGREVNTGLACG
jgi:hypothetical protein